MNHDIHLTKNVWYVLSLSSEDHTAFQVQFPREQFHFRFIVLLNRDSADHQKSNVRALARQNARCPKKEVDAFAGHETSNTGGNRRAGVNAKFLADRPT